MRRSFQLLGVAPAVHIAVEKDAIARAVAKNNFPAIREIHELSDVTHERLLELTADCPHVKHLLVTAGFPCQDLSGINAAGKGLDGEGGIHDISYIHSCYQTLISSTVPCWPRHL